MNIRPLNNRIAVRPKPVDEVSAGGIVIPDSVSEKPMEGEVVAVGKGRYLESGDFVPVDLKVGDIILYAKQAGQEVQIDGETYLIMEEDEILTVVEV